MHIKTLALTAFAGTAVAQMNLTQALNTSSELTTLSQLLAGFPEFTQQLSNTPNITLLAPTNAAISALLNSSVGPLVSSDAGLLGALLTYHILNGTYTTFSNTTSFIRTALEGQSDYANVTGGQRIQATGSGTNATIYSGLKTKSTTSGTLNFTNGAIRIIDRVLSIPGNISSTAVAFNLTAAAGALTRANLVTAVDTTPDLTVFVPNNAAFQRIGSALSNLTTQQIASILQYHVVPGTVGYSTLLRNESLTTLQGNNLTITLSGSSVFVNSARVVIPDVLVANGVVHVIDNILSPNNTATPTASATTGSPAFTGATSASSVPFTSGVPTPTSSIDTSSIAASATASHSSSSSAGAAWMPKPTGLGAALMAGGAIVLAL